MRACLQSLLFGCAFHVLMSCSFRAQEFVNVRTILFIEGLAMFSILGGNDKVRFIITSSTGCDPDLFYGIWLYCAELGRVQRCCSYDRCY